MSAAARLAAAVIVAAGVVAPYLCDAAPIWITTSTAVGIQPYAAFGTSRAETVVVAAPATFEARVTIPPHARLTTAVAVADYVGTAKIVDTAQPVRFRIVFVPEGGATTVLYERVVDVARRTADRRWFEIGRDLGAFAGHQGTLRFETTLAEPSASNTRTRALWAPPDLAACGDDAGPSVVLIVVDALRADHLGTMGYARPTTPHLDAFARSATRFGAAFSAGPKPFPSVPQLLTGVAFDRLRQEPGLSSWLSRGRYESSRAIVSSPSAAWWILKEQPSFGALASGELDARAMTSAALRWLSATGRCRTALYLHYFDTHPPYRSPTGYARMFIDRSAKTTIGLTFEDPTGAWNADYEDADRQRVIDLYDGAIAWTDRQLGRLFRGLARRRLLDRTLIIVTADHGEELWDHGKFFHGQSLYDELLHVPLLVRMPGQTEARDVTAVASTLDVVPTIAAVAGFPPPSGDGRSLAPMLTAAPAASPAAPDDRAVFATVSYPEPRTPPRHAVRSTTRKLIRNVEDGRIELYDIAADPQEKRNLGLAGAGGRELLAALDTTRLRIADVGDQLRLTSHADHPVRYTVTVTPDPVAAIADPDRLTLEAGDLVKVGPFAASLELTGTLAPGDEDRVRFDVPAPTAKLNIALTIDGAAAPEGTLRVGAAQRPSGLTIDLADPAVQGAPEPDAVAPTAAARTAGEPAPSPGTTQSAAESRPVVVSFWRVPFDAAKRPGARTSPSSE